MSFRSMDLMIDVTPAPLLACPNSGGPGGGDPDENPDDCPNSGSPTGYTSRFEDGLPELRRELRATLEAQA